MWVVTLVLNMVHKSLTKYMYTTFRYKQFTISAPVELSVLVFIGVGGGGGRALPPRLKNFRAYSVFRASASCSKILKKNTFNIVNSGHPLFFRASASCSKILNVKSIFHTAKKFLGNSVFRGKR